jgi:hypothetical protein
LSSYLLRFIEAKKETDIEKREDANLTRNGKTSLQSNQLFGW